MSFGLFTQSSSGFVQIDQEFVCVHEIMSGFVSAASRKWSGYPENYYAEVDITAAPVNSGGWECVVFLKPTQPNKWVGGTVVQRDYGQIYPHLSAVGQCPFYFKVFHVSGTPITYADSHGMEIFKQDGSISYSSKRRYPAVFSNIYTQIPVSDTYPVSPYAMSVPIPDIGEIPWVLGNSLYMTPADAGVLVLCARFPNTSTMELANLEQSAESFEFYPWAGGATLPVTTALARITS